MTRYYTGSDEFLAIRFCGDAKATLFMTDNQKALLFDPCTQSIYDDCGRIYTHEEFMKLLLSLPHAGEEEMMRRFESLDVSFEKENASPFIF